MPSFVKMFLTGLERRKLCRKTFIHWQYFGCVSDFTDKSIGKLEKIDTYCYICSVLIASNVSTVGKF
jgi:hypothetical protein